MCLPRNCVSCNSAVFFNGKFFFRIKYEKDKKNICKGLTKAGEFGIISIVENDGPLQKALKRRYK